MNKLLAALIAGLFAFSINTAFAADAAAPDAGVTKEKPAAAPAKKAHKAKKAKKMEEKKDAAPAAK